MSDVYNGSDEKNAKWTVPKAADTGKSPEDVERDRIVQELEASGGLQQVIDLASTGALVFLKKRDGTWGKGTVNTLLDDGNSVAVTPEGSSMTIFKTTDFLKWQEDGLVDDSASASAGRIRQEIQDSESERFIEKQQKEIRERASTASNLIKEEVEKLINGGVYFSDRHKEILINTLADRDGIFAQDRYSSWTDKQIRELYTVLYGEDVDEFTAREKAQMEANKLEDLRRAEKTIAGILDRASQFPLDGALRKIVNICLERLRKSGNTEDLDYDESNFYKAAYDEEFRKDHYPGWSAADVKDLYKVLYNEELE